MATLTVTEDQLKLIQSALDFYSRVGIGQMWVIKDHPTFQRTIEDKLRPKKELEVGDRTERGEIVEIGKDYIKTRGSWGSGEEVRTWIDIENIKLSIDWGKFHQIREEGEALLNEGRNHLLQDQISYHGSYGIHHPQVDESCRVAYDLIQVIRHEFWKINPKRSMSTVDSSVTLWTKDADKIKCDLEKK